MADILTLVSDQKTVNTSVANTVGDSVFVRLVNPAASAATITIYTAGNSAVNTTTVMLANSEMYLKKSPSDTIISNSSVIIGNSVKVRGA